MKSLVVAVFLAIVMFRPIVLADKSSLSRPSLSLAVEQLFSNDMQSGPVGVYRQIDHKIFAREAYLARIRGSASAWIDYAKAAESADDYDLASTCWYKASTILEDKVDKNMSSYALDRSQQFETQIGIYQRLPAQSDWYSKLDTHLRLEPDIGCYTGAFIDNETTLPVVMKDGNNDIRRDPNVFNQLTAIHHAFFFIYLGYGQPFPMEWAKILKANGSGLQIAFEPNKYSEVKKDQYLTQFALDAKHSGIPIFLRFASEMNGDWVPYHNSPTRYIKMFKTVSAVMHSTAPNVAMMWCPFEIPIRLIDRYYPGDSAVDWVGVNIYSVLYNDNDPSRNAQNRNPADSLAYIYDKYSDKHPIAIGEYGAAHMSSLNMKQRDDYAIVKLEQFYTSLKLLYPRVKAVHWLSMNAIIYAMPGRQLNDYSLVDAPKVMEAYREVNQNPYFLKDYSKNATEPVEYKPVQDGTEVSGAIHLDSWVKTYTNVPTVVWQLDDKEINRIVQPGDYGIDLDTTSLTNGMHRIDVIALDQDGYEAGRESVRIIVNNSRTTDLNQ